MTKTYDSRISSIKRAVEAVGSQANLARGFECDTPGGISMDKRGEGGSGCTVPRHREGHRGQGHNGRTETRHIWVAV